MPNFGIDAVIAVAHSRRDAHYGFQSDTTIVTDGSTGYAPGTTLADMLVDLFTRAGNIKEPLGRFGLSAFIHPYFEVAAILRKEQTGSFGLDARIGGSGSATLNAIIHTVRSGIPFGLAAYILGDSTWNVVQAPAGGTASYSAITYVGAGGSPVNFTNWGPPNAADGRSTTRWGKTGWVSGDWWQVSWTSPQRINRVRLTDGGPPSANRFGNSGELRFSDGSVVPYSGLQDNTITINFSSRVVAYMRVVTLSTGGSTPALIEVEAFDTEQWS